MSNMQQQNVQEEDKNQKYIIVATLSFLVGFGLAWLITGNRAAAPTSSLIDRNATNAVTEEASTTATAANSVAVNDQPAGTEVSISSVVLENPGWVVIHEDDNGKPGRILGAQLFDKGINAGKVDLLRGMTAGKIYYAMLHNDNGDHAFEPKKDLSLEENGTPIMQVFKALSGSTVSINTVFSI